MLALCLPLLASASCTVVWLCHSSALLSTSASPALSLMVCLPSLHTALHFFLPQLPITPSPLSLLLLYYSSLNLSLWIGLGLGQVWDGQTGLLVWQLVADSAATS